MRRRYEVWFVRCGLADSSGAWWFRYLLVNNIRMAPETSPGRHLQVWASWFARRGAPQSFIVETPLEQLDLSARGHVPFHCRSGECGIEEGRCWGNLRANGHPISWDLRIQSNFGETLSDKGWIGFSRSPHSDGAFSGEIIFNGKKVNGEPLGFGVQGHNCGYRHRNYWRWMHAYFPQPGGAARWKRWCTTCRSHWYFETPSCGIVGNPASYDQSRNWRSSVQTNSYGGALRGNCLTVLRSKPPLMAQHQEFMNCHILGPTARELFRCPMRA
jgi:hypothetical protein